VSTIQRLVIMTNTSAYPYFIYIPAAHGQRRG
jgi:hypothetical protein